jgi:hypothetical protein
MRLPVPLHLVQLAQWLELPISCHVTCQHTFRRTKSLTSLVTYHDSFLMYRHVPRYTPPSHNVLSFRWSGLLFDSHSAVTLILPDPSTLLSSFPCACDQRRVIPVLYLYPLNDSFVPKRIILLPQHAEVWEHGKVIPNLLSHSLVTQ